MEILRNLLSYIRNTLQDGKKYALRDEIYKHIRDISIAPRPFL